MIILWQIQYSSQTVFFSDFYHFQEHFLKGRILTNFICGFINWSKVFKKTGDIKKWCWFFHLKTKWGFWPKTSLFETVLVLDFKNNSIAKNMKTFGGIPIYAIVSVFCHRRRGRQKFFVHFSRPNIRALSLEISMLTTESWGLWPSLRSA